jgi:hypothetical protein
MSDIGDLEVNFDEIDKMEARGNVRYFEVSTPPRKKLVSFDAQFPVFRDRCGGAVRPKPDICEIEGCDRPATCLDHCHRTGRFRGWVCQSCNSRLAIFGYSAEVLNFCAYLVRFGRTFQEEAK